MRAVAALRGSLPGTRVVVVDGLACGWALVAASMAATGDAVGGRQPAAAVGSRSYNVTMIVLPILLTRFDAPADVVAAVVVMVRTGGGGPALNSPLATR